jgi:tripartite-type tricarboxylate transporter receptor subunit TctC
MVLLVNEASPYKTWADFLKAAKAKPMGFATSGTGSVAHVDNQRSRDVIAKAGIKLE